MKIEQRVVDSVDLKVRKDLIEAKIYLKLGQIFKDVGLTAKAAEKADEGLSRVNDVIATSIKASLERAVVEEAFSIKWDLLLVKDNLAEAIEVCRMLTQLFPDSTPGGSGAAEDRPGEDGGRRPRRSDRHLPRRPGAAQVGPQGRGPVQHRRHHGKRGDQGRRSAAGRSRPWRT